MPQLSRLLIATSPMMRGDDVLAVQRQLAAFGSGPTQDGLYGNGTATAVRNFQATHNLEADGIVGPATWRALFGDAAAGGPAAIPGRLGDTDLAALGAMHGFYKDGCSWRLTADGIEVDGRLQSFTSRERTGVSSIITRFRQDIITALAAHPVPIELILACISTESDGQPESLRMEPGCDPANPENTPSRVSEGLMQTLLSTAREALNQPGLRLAELRQPQVSILAGAAYMHRQALQTHYDPPLAAAAYNAGSLRYNGSSNNRWKLLQYPIGTSQHCDRFASRFNAAMALIDAVELPDHVPSFRRMLRGAPAVPRPQPQPAPVSGARADIANAIRAAAQQLGADAVTLAAMAFIESSLRVDARSSTSSAFGLFQFLDGTWGDVVQRHGAALGVTVADRADLRAQCLMGAAFLQDNVRTLQNGLGRPPRPAECYAAHFFGAGTAANLLRGGPDVQADVALGERADRVIAANRPIFLEGGRIRTVGEVMGVFDSKMRNALAQAETLLGAVSAAVANTTTTTTSTTTAPAASGEPSWLTIARGEIGQKEAEGAADNPRIREYFAATTAGPRPDSVPWCGAFVSFCLHQAGMIEQGSALASDWLKFGDRLDQPRVGCITVLRPQAPGASGHVGFWVKQEDGRIHLLAGNQHDRVDITSYSVAELAENGLRWPHGA